MVFGAEISPCDWSISVALEGGAGRWGRLEIWSDQRRRVVQVFRLVPQTSQSRR